jgi:hypothetical protein
VVAGEPGNGTVSPVGTFTTAAGLKLFEIDLGTVVDPTWSLGDGISPYLHLGRDGFVPPLLTGSGSCPVVRFGSEDFCQVVDPLDTPIPDDCATATVSYELVGIEGSGVRVRAWPTTKGVLDDGTISFRAAIEADGPAGEGNVELGCLTRGLDYNIVIDVVGDAGGALGVEQITAP